MSQQQISRYENGQSAISIDSLHTYLKVLGKDWLDYFRSVILVRVHANYY
ncbi:helix-turn-helix domain-containing protein [Providencia rettgeri]